MTLVSTFKYMYVLHITFMHTYTRYVLKYIDILNFAQGVESACTATGFSWNIANFMHL